MLNAERIMTRNVLTVHPETPAMEAIKIMVDRKISGLPVVDANLKLCGIISERDMLVVLVESEDRAGIENYMTRNVATFGPKSSLVDITDYFLANASGRVPIVDDTGALVGVVSRGDLLKAIVRLRTVYSQYK